MGKDYQRRQVEERMDGFEGLFERWTVACRMLGVVQVDENNVLTQQ